MKTSPRVGRSARDGRAARDGRSAREQHPAYDRPEDDTVGRTANTPTHIPWAGWKQILVRTYKEVASDQVSLVAAGCAFWATLALFPAISMLISLYGLVFDPRTVEPQLETIRDFLPPAAYTLIDTRVHGLVASGSGTLGVSLAISVLLAFWTSSTGTKSLLSALNMAYNETEQRGFVRFQLVGFAMTAAIVLGAILAIAILVFIPVVIGFVGLSSHTKTLVNAASLVILVLFVLCSVSLLYRYGPSRHKARLEWITPGSLVATALWLLVSVLFSFYVAHIASYDATYGPLGAVAGVMMWFWVSAYSVLLGAELNAEMEMQTARDSTEGSPKPIGRRGAYVADHVAED
jgi:membrane protein